ncbi:MAG: sporulation protein YabP [Clostridia bacterium]|nr:sporulation protein YabP [Clostridia bacterium]
MKNSPAVTPRPHTLNSADRHTLSLTGVTDVDSFDDTAIVAYTDFGGLTIRGEDLHITRLSLDNGELDLEGSLLSLVYSGVGGRRKGLLGKLFR